VNKTYECVYGFQKSAHQYLLQEDVFKKGNQLIKETCLNRTPFRITSLFGINKCLDTSTAINNISKTLTTINKISKTLGPVKSTNVTKFK
jgi:hypothetical protein